MTRATVASLLALVAMVQASAVAKPPPAPALDRALDRIAGATGGPPGVSVLIERGDRRELRSRGFADLGARRRPTARDHMRLASMSKAYSGAVALELVRAGRLHLGDLVAGRLPGLLPRAGNVALAQALRHTSGLPDYIRQPAFVALLQSDPAQRMTPRQLLSFIRDEPLHFPPSLRYEYSDSDNIVVGLMAEAVTRSPYEDLLARGVYAPLGLRQTSLPRTLAMPRPVLRGYDVTPGQPPEDVTRLINPALAWASGGMVSTPLEVARFFRAYVRGRFSSPRLRRIQRHFVGGESSPPGPGRNASGLGLFRYATRCGTVYGHTGSFPGYRLFAAARGDGRRAVVFSVNAQIVPGQGSPRVARMIRQAQLLAVCRALR